MLRAGNCEGSHVDPVIHFSPDGKILTMFGHDMINYPHGLYVDRDNNIWVTDTESNLVAGRGDPVILMHGYAQNSHMWRPTMRELAKTHLVVAPDLRGFGDTTKAESGYDK